MCTLLKKHLIVFILLALVTPLSVNAADTQFYFLARQAPAGSITSAGQTQQVVYLRWDPVEGELPADVVSFRLLRNGSPLSNYDLPAQAVMPAGEINNLYLGATQQRRKLELVTRLNEMAASNGDVFSVANFASMLHGLLNPAAQDTYHELWAFLGSRTDINIARARYRGWVDTTPGSGTVEYELLAVNASGDTARLGFTRVELGVPDMLLGATNLRQVLNSDTRCDLPEDFKDHFTVALNWDSPGEAPGEDANNLIVSDRIAAQLYISGFDLYRTSENLADDVKVAPVRDIATLAAAVSTDGRGNPQITGLERVNQSIVIDPGKTTQQPKWLEARDLLKRAGMKPGDRRAYYLVPRDFTGNYGPTVARIVEVPLMTRPPAPWNLRTFADETSSALARGASDAFTLIWDQVNLDNYIRMFQDTRRYCNLLEAQQSGVLEFVGIDQSCENDVHSSVRLDVVDYRIYRFTDFDVAGRFKDSDGDGFSDADERELGVQCDATQFPPLSEAYNYLALVPPSLTEATDYLAPVPDDIQLISGGGLSPTDPEIVHLRDKVPALTSVVDSDVTNKDTVYWYRIASVAGIPDENGRLSFLSAPQRGLFPNREPPLEPDVEVMRPGKNPAGCELISDPGAPWSFSEEINTNEIGNNFTLSCSTEFFSAPGVSSVTGSSCLQIIKECYGDSDIVLTSPATELTGNVECSATVPNDVKFCESGSLTLVPKIIDEMVPVLPGDLISGGVTATICPQPNTNTCVALYETIDGSSTRIENRCDGSCIIYQPGEGPFCGYAVASDENNNISTAVHFPCTISPSIPKAPTPPQILSFEVDDSFARFSYRLPAQQTAITMTQLDHEPGDGLTNRTNKAIPAINAEPGQILSNTMPADQLQVSKDRFCLRLKAVARRVGKDPALTSPWSKQRCYTRLAGGEEDLPVYMPWPTVKAPVQGEILQGGLLTTFRKVPQFLAMRFVKAGGLLNGCERILPGQIPGNTAPPVEPVEESKQFDNLECTNGGMGAVTAALEPYMNFILYRQSRIMGGTAGNWIQVSPLIEFAHFDKIPTRVSVKGTKFIEWRLNDPFVKFLPGADTTDELIFIFLDRYPFISFADLSATQLYEYRYQAVYFDSAHKPVRWRQSDWFREEE